MFWSANRGPNQPTRTHRPQHEGRGDILSFYVWPRLMALYIEHPQAYVQKPYPMSLGPCPHSCCLLLRPLPAAGCSRSALSIALLRRVPRLFAVPAKPAATGGDDRSCGSAQGDAATEPGPGSPVTAELGLRAACVSGFRQRRAQTRRAALKKAGDTSPAPSPVNPGNWGCVYLAIPPAITRSIPLAITLAILIRPFAPIRAAAGNSPHERVTHARVANPRSSHRTQGASPGLIACCPAPGARRMVSSRRRGRFVRACVSNRAARRPG